MTFVNISATLADFFARNFTARVDVNWQHAGKISRK